eukprot:TRINITY_DN616_c0_g1_i1.p1 TRINITY_DN616_c0_g1~~TRINITY_DN616_c0_g1_i1.p1  ORF type:complete len:586 (-),score=150.90 TRINITY_DN616_c0_g1_i1:174-1931(-)
MPSPFDFDEASESDSDDEGLGTTRKSVLSSLMKNPHAYSVLNDDDHTHADAHNDGHADEAHVKDGDVEAEEEAKVVEDEEEEEDGDVGGEQYDRRVVYITSQRLLALSKFHPIHSERELLVHHLIKSYGLLDEMRIIHSEPATARDLLEFHSRDYVTMLQGASASVGAEVRHADLYDEFGLVDDCPPYNGMYEHSLAIAGASITAAKELARLTSVQVQSSSSLSSSPHAPTTTRPIVVNWFGGRHHCKRDGSAGFCYVNDIVLCILELLNTFDRVLYIDIDIHHGDGVEEAFSTTDSVCTLSFHRKGPGYYPGTGGVDDIGCGSRGRYHSFNLPLNEGVTDTQYVDFFHRITTRLVERYRPQSIVMQCGADGLAGDPLGGFNLTADCLGKCVLHIINQDIPLILLGGGGYECTNVSRCWTFLTGIAVASRAEQVMDADGSGDIVHVKTADEIDVVNDRVEEGVCDDDAAEKDNRDDDDDQERKRRRLGDIDNSYSNDNDTGRVVGQVVGDKSVPVLPSTMTDEEIRSFANLLPNIPEHCLFSMYESCSFQLHCEEGMRQNLNEEKDVGQVVGKLLRHIDAMRQEP